MKSIGEAIAAIVPAFRLLETVELPLLESRGFHLAEDVRARWDSPPFDNSAMDGYAVHADDLAGVSAEAPRRFPIVGESRAGGPLPEALARRTVCRIFTGAPIPALADAVVVQEDTTREGDEVEIRFAPRRGHHIRHRGSDVASGGLLLSAGLRIGGGEIGLAASQGITRLRVHRRPRVAIVSTGDELVELGDPIGAGQIVNSNAYQLAALVADAGAEPWLLPLVNDDADRIAERFRAARSADVVISTGGVSVGAYDAVHEGMRRAGIELSFAKVRMKPGKPVAFAVVDAVPVVALPGNPASAFVGFELFVRPGLRRMQGDPRPYAETLRVVLANDHRRSPGRPELARARLERSPTRTIAHLHAQQGSGSLPSLAAVDALVLLPAERDRFVAGEELLALVIGGGAGSSTVPFE